MSMIRVENLTFAYSSSYDNIFDNATFQIDTNWKLGLVGRNGRGKTTLLNLLLGKYDYQGNIISSVQFDYFPYPISDKKRITEEIVNEICPLAEEWEVIRELSYLDVDAEVLWRPFETLSNGEQTKVLLAALFLNEGHFLLIDEPTNHLAHDYIVNPVMKYVARPVNHYVVKPIANYVVKPLYHNIVQPVVKPIYGKVVKPVGNFINQNILKPMGRLFKNMFKSR